MSDAGKTKPLRFDKFTIVSIFGADIGYFRFSICDLRLVSDLTIYKIAKHFGSQELQIANRNSE
jgi:hypothetical protein